MPSGNVHSTVTVAASIGIALLPYNDIVIPALGCLSGMILTPDLDHDSGHIGYEFVRKMGGNIFESWWHGVWRPYQIAMKHRSFWSHFPVVSTLVRIIYLFCPLIINAIKDQKSTGGFRVGALSVRSQLLAMPFWLLLPVVMMYPIETVWFICGLMFSDFWHWVFDQMF